MIETAKRDFLIALIDLEVGIVNNDAEMTAATCETVNSLEKDASMEGQVDRVILNALDKENYQNAAAYRVALNNIDCVPDREHRLAVLDVECVMRRDDKNEIATFIENLVDGTLDFNGDADQRAYATTLIRLCSYIKRYDLMDVIRAKLAEVV